MSMTGATMKKVVGIICLVLGFAATASAAEISGTLNFTGAVTVTAGAIDWLDDDGIPDAITLKQPVTGYFSAMDTGALSPGIGSAVDLGAPPIVGFLHDFQENPDVATEYDDLSFDLFGITAPIAPPCSLVVVYADGSSCSLGVFTLAQVGGNTNVTLNVTGQFVDPTYLGGAITPAGGIYTAQRTGGINSLLAEVAVTGSVTNSYSAVFTAVPDTTEVPEPATLLTFGAGTTLLAAHRRRRAKKNAQA
jgi:hypothetical protein